MAGVNDAVVTTNFFARPVYNPENTILGASFRHAEYANLVAPGDYELAPVEQDRFWETAKPEDIAGHYGLARQWEQHDEVARDPTNARRRGALTGHRYHDGHPGLGREPPCRTSSCLEIPSSTMAPMSVRIPMSPASGSEDVAAPGSGGGPLKPKRSR